MKKVVLGVALAAIASSTASAQIISVGAHSALYVGFSRGFSYVAPVDHTIVRLELPQESFTAGALASYIVDVNPLAGGITEVYSVGNAGAIAVTVNVLAGDLVLIIGNWTDGAAGQFTARNSYASGAPSPQLLLGNPVDLSRAGFQFDIGAGTYASGNGFTGLTGSYGRIFVTVIPAPASLALLGLGGLVAVRRRR